MTNHNLASDALTDQHTDGLLTPGLIENGDGSRTARVNFDAADRSGLETGLSRTLGRDVRLASVGWSLPDGERTQADYTAMAAVSLALKDVRQQRMAAEPQDDAARLTRMLEPIDLIQRVDGGPAYVAGVVIGVPTGNDVYLGNAAKFDIDGAAAGFVAQTNQYLAEQGSPCRL